MKRYASFSLFCIYFCLAVGVLVMSANAFAAAMERSKNYRHFSDALTPVVPPEFAITWGAPTRPLVRNFTATDEEMVGRALGQAWRAHAAAMSGGNPAVLPDYFSGVALHRAQISAQSGFEAGTQLVVLEQNPRAEFYHLDGSLLQIASENLSVRFAISGDTLDYFDVSHDETITILMNETTGWRVFAHEITSFKPISGNPTGVNFDEPLAGVNYYPAATPWTRFWPEFDPEIVRNDFQIISDLGANSVRIFLPSADFSSDGSPALGALEILLGLAHANGLRVVPTLFDLKIGYDPSLWSDDVGYLKRVLPILAASDAVAFVDIKNEPDLDFDTYGTPLIEAWIRTMLMTSREIAPSIPLTVGWSSADAAIKLADLVDVVSYHDYAPMDETSLRLDMVVEAASGKPVYVTEIGASSYNAALGMPGSQASQRDALSSRFAGLGAADGVFVWTLHDFKEPDAKAIGNSPWVRRLQANFGLIDTKGVPKHSAQAATVAFRHFLGAGEAE